MREVTGPSPSPGQLHVFRFPEDPGVLGLAEPVDFAYDVGSGALLQIDEALRAVFLRLRDDLTPSTGVEGRAGSGFDVEATPDEALRALSCFGGAGGSAAREAKALVEDGVILTPLPGRPADGGLADPEAAAADAPPVKALCLNVAHRCNLRCDYCFAGEALLASESSVPALMAPDTAKASVDFLLDRSDGRRVLEIDFFGGEPLLNFDAVVETMRYARRRGRDLGKHVRYAITTNCLLLDEEVLKAIKEYDVFVVASIDGRAEVHDQHRRFPSGDGSYSAVLERLTHLVRTLERPGDAAEGSAEAAPCGTGESAEESFRGRDLAASYHGLRYFVRGTFTRGNLDFAEDVFHLAALGFENISLEPVVLPPENPLSLREQDLPQVFLQYERIALAKRNGARFNFFHFMVDPLGGPCLRKRIRGCGAGWEYLAVDPRGTIFPCHQLVGKGGFAVGDVRRGIAKPRELSRFRAIDVFTKAPCGRCWARFHCAGGCKATSYLITGSLEGTDHIGCALQRKRLECALYLRSHL